MAKNTRQKKLTPKLPPSEIKARHKKQLRDYLNRFWSIATIYYTVLMGFVVIATCLILRHHDWEEGVIEPPFWVATGQWIVFYILPITLSLGFAWHYRSIFWTALRQMFLVLVGPLVLFSLAGLWLYGFEQNLLTESVRRLGQTEFDIIAAKINDNDQNSRQIEIIMKVNHWQEEAVYFFHAFYSQYGWPLPDDVVGSVAWIPAQDEDLEAESHDQGTAPKTTHNDQDGPQEKSIRFIAEINEEMVGPFLKRGPVDVDMVITATAMAPDEKTWLRLWWFWMPFFKPVEQNGQAYWMKRTKVLRSFKGVVQIPPRWVSRNGHVLQLVDIQDAGEVIEEGERKRRFVIKVQSMLSSPAVARMAFWGLPYDVESPAVLKKGTQEIVFDVAMRHFEEYGVTPPYYIGRLTITNHDPSCRPQCPPAGSLSFTIHTAPGLIPVSTSQQPIR